MRVKGASIQQILLGMALLAAVCWNLAHAGELRGLQLATGPTGTRAELRMDSEAGYQLISLAGPDRLPEGRKKPHPHAHGDTVIGLGPPRKQS